MTARPNAPASNALHPKRLADEPARAAGPTPGTSVRQQIQDASDILSSILDSTADGILVVDTEGKVLVANRRFAELWNIPSGLLSSRDDDALLAYVLDQLLDPDAFMAKVKALYATSVATGFDVLHFKDGRVFERYSRPHSLDGEVVGRVWTFRDVTEQQRGRESLRASEAKYRGLYEHAPVAYLTLGPHGIIEDANRQAEELTGRKRTALIGLPIHALWYNGGDELKRSSRLMAQIERGEPFEAQQVRWLGGAGTPRTVMLTARPMKRDEGEVIQNRVTAVDVSDRVTAEEHLRASLAQLSRAEKLAALGTLVAGVAHEINNPLTYVKTNEVLIQRRIKDLKTLVADDGRLSDALESLDATLEINRTGIQRIEAIVKSLRQATKPTEGQKESQDLVAVVRDTLPILEPIRRGRDITFDTDLPDHIVPAELDSTGISQVLLNLVGNAFEATPRGKNVSLRLSEDDDTVSIQIVDQGPGVPEEFQERIFDPFYTTKRDGNGLGLYVSNEIVNAHDGEIRHGPRDDGYCFELILPRSDRTPPTDD